MSDIGILSSPQTPGCTFFSYYVPFKVQLTFLRHFQFFLHLFSSLWTHETSVTPYLEVSVTISSGLAVLNGKVVIPGAVPFHT